MVLPDPNLSEQKRRISESLCGIKEIIELIHKAPEKYLPESAAIISMMSPQRPSRMIRLRS